ncbi:hypothetical protein EHO59_04835 [Leptospira semungkisensis]|uniref:Uncharacterized protein n=1 Tax=Leptospira semungkisensis TaxID=2484985 RepID=A0A4R9G7I3_9LEPT|nr:hypothetical protein EHO59_04835 [Leptospira semungkisensis]
MSSNSPISSYISRFQAEKGSVKTFLSKFPFYGEILKNHQYYDADRLARAELSKRLDSLKEPIRRIEEDFVKDRRLDLIGSTEVLLSLVERLKNEIVGASYGLNGLGTGFKASESELEALAEWDYSLLHHAEELAEKCKAHSLNRESTMDAVRDWVSKFRGELDEFDSALKKRRDVFLKQ